MPGSSNHKLTSFLGTMPTVGFGKQTADIAAKKHIKGRNKYLLWHQSLDCDNSVIAKHGVRTQMNPA